MDKLKRRENKASRWFVFSGGEAVGER